VSVFSPAVKARFWHRAFWFCLVRSRVLHLTVGFVFPLFRSTLRVVLRSSLGSARRSVLFPAHVFIALSSRTHFARRSSCVCGTSSQFVLIPAGLYLIRSGLSFRSGASPLSWSCLLIPVFTRLVCYLVVIPWQSIERVHSLRRFSTREQSSSGQLPLS
jgi:hypothetical protein